MRISERIRYLLSGGERARLENDGLIKSLDAEAAKLRGADPDTRHQWQLLDAGIERAESSALHPRRHAAQIRFATVGISLAILAIVVIALLPGQRPSTLTYETGRGEQSTVVLPDSSTVVLNHTTVVTLSPESPGKNRVVTLEGEAFFRIRRTGLPFTVTTDVGTVQVLGTEFNVRTRDEHLEVAVIQGSVRLSAKLGGRDSSVILGVGEIARCTRGGFPEAPERILLADYPGWLHGKLTFQKARLRSVCREIEARFGVTIQIKDQKLQEETLTGTLDAQSAETAVATLSSLTGLKIRHEKDAFILY